MFQHRDSKGKFEETKPGKVILSPLASIQRRFSPAMATGVLCFALSLFFYYGTVLRVQLKRTDFLDLGPYPDAVEYFAQANSILKGEAPAIQIGYDRLPSRYPPGYPLLMVPWLRFLPHNGILAPFRTNQTVGLLLLIGAFALYLAIGRPLAGGLGTLLLATQPAFVSFSRSSMSDVSGAAVAVLAFVLVYIGLRRARRWPIYCAAIVLGLSLCIRPQLLFFVPLLIAMALFPRVGDSWPRWLMHCCLVFVVFALASLPYFVFNAFQFGHPLKTGYDFWVPAWTESARLFSVHNVPAQLAMLWSESSASWDVFRVANLFGTGTYIVPAFVLLAVLGLAFVRMDRFALAAFLGSVSYFVATLTYAFVDGRFYLPLFLLLAGLAVLPVAWAVSQVLELRFSVSTVALLLIFLLSIIGYPSQSGFKPTRDRSQAWDALNYANSTGRSPRYEAQKELARSFRDAPGIVLSDIDPPYLNVLLPKPFTAAPIDENHYYRYSQLWHYGKAEALRLVQSGLDRGTPVYALFFPSTHVDHDIQRLPSIYGYSWKRSEKSNVRALIMVLTKESSALVPRSMFRLVEMPNETFCSYPLL
jgi:hypothetical protein